MTKPLHPCDLEAETVVLGSILLDSSKLDEVSDFLRPEHFYAIPHQELFEALVALRLSNRHIDNVSVSGWLKDKYDGKWEDGVEYMVSALKGFMPETDLSHVVDHARRVRDKWRLRRMLAEFQRAEADITANASEDTSSLIDALEHRVYDAARQVESADSAEDVGGIVNAHLARLEAIRRGDLAPGGIPTGFNCLDRLTGGWRARELTIVAARPALGKSSIAIQAALSIAERGYGAMVFSLEMPSDQNLMRMACNKAGVNLLALRSNTLSATEWSKYKTAALEIAELPLSLDDKATINMLEIRAKTRRKKAELERHGKELALVVIDYMQLVRPKSTANKSRNREQEISEISRDAKGIAMDLGVSVMALSQLNRDTERGDSPRKPRLSDLRESGAIEQDADNIMFLWHSEAPVEEDPIWDVDLVVAKQRNGPIGDVNLRFHRAYTRFEGI